MANTKPGRPTMSAEEWLKDDEKMLTWLTNELENQGLLVWERQGVSRRDYLLEALNQPLGDTNPGELLKRLKARWRSHKSDLRYGKHTLRTNLSAKSYRELQKLAQGATLSHTVSRIIEEAFHTEQEKKEAIQAAVEERRAREEKSIEEAIEKRRLRDMRQKKEIRDLKAELELADTHILELYREILSLKQQVKDDPASIDSEQREEVFRSAEERLATHRNLRKHEIKQRPVNPDEDK